MTIGEARELYKIECLIYGQHRAWVRYLAEVDAYRQAEARREGER
jgi:hypothetical protein